MNYKHLVIIGAPKCGTSSMHKILDEHPHISMAIGKEIDFFIDEENNKTDYSDYLKNFEITNKTQVIGEASPRYANGLTSLDCFDGILETLGKDVLLVYMVRDPLERLVSHYFHRLRMGIEFNELGEAVNACNVYKGGSNYPKYIELIETLFGKKPYIIEFSQFTKNPRKEASQLISKLGLDASLLPEKGIDHFNIGDKVGVNANSNPLRYKLLMLIKRIVKSVRHLFPKTIKGKVKKMILGGGAHNRESNVILNQKSKILKENQNYFEKIKSSMAINHEVKTEHWYY